MTKELELICNEVDLKVSNGHKVSIDAILKNLGLNNESEFAMEAYRGFAKEYSGLALDYFSKRMMINTGIGIYNIYKVGLFGFGGSLAGAMLSKGSVVGALLGGGIGLLIGFLSELSKYKNYNMQEYIEHQTRDLNTHYQEKRKEMLKFYGLLASSK